MARMRPAVDHASAGHPDSAPRGRSSGAVLSLRPWVGRSVAPRRSRTRGWLRYSEPSPASTRRGSGEGIMRLIGLACIAGAALGLACAAGGGQRAAGETEEIRVSDGFPGPDELAAIARRPAPERV